VGFDRTEDSTARLPAVRAPPLAGLDPFESADTVRSVSSPSSVTPPPVGGHAATA
jgi:hypothetical protein